MTEILDSFVKQAKDFLYTSRLKKLEKFFISFIIFTVTLIKDHKGGENINGRS